MGRMSLRDYPASLTLRPLDGRPVDADVNLPGSKSITNRALLLAALADGTSTLTGALRSEDTVYMADALRDLGVTVEEDGAKITVTGRGGHFAHPAKSTLFIGNSGTTVRFLTAAACLMPEGSDVVLDGVARMRERPIRDLLGALITLGVNAEAVNGHGCPPVRVRGGGLPGGRCSLRGDVSSQYLTALLQVAPYAKSDVDITIVGGLISKPYIEITRAVMNAFGADFENDEYLSLHIRSGQRYHGIDYSIEADASNASYFMAAAAVTGGRVKLQNLGSTSIQGDIAFADVLERMGCRITRGAQIEVTGPKKLKAVDADMTLIPDTAQTLAAAAIFADGPSHITGIGSLRVKETDRIAAITNELRKLGARVDEGPENWTIYPIEKAPESAAIATYEDHRMAMSFAVAGLRLPDITIDDPGCVAKTFPDFWETWKEAFDGV